MLYVTMVLGKGYINKLEKQYKMVHKYQPYYGQIKSICVWYSEGSIRVGTYYSTGDSPITCSQFLELTRDQFLFNTLL